MNLDQALSAVRRAPLGTLTDCAALLAACVSRLADFERQTHDVDLSDALDALAVAHDKLEETYAIPVGDVIEHYESLRVDERIDEAKEERAFGEAA